MSLLQDGGKCRTSCQINAKDSNAGVIQSKKPCRILTIWCGHVDLVSSPDSRHVLFVILYFSFCKMEIRGTLKGLIVH